MKLSLVLALSSFTSYAVAYDVDLSLYPEGEVTNGVVICTGGTTTTYQENNTPGSNGVLVNKECNPTRCVEVNDLASGCEIEFWSEVAANDRICAGDLVDHYSGGAPTKFLIEGSGGTTGKASCVLAFCGIDTPVKAWIIGTHSETDCTDEEVEGVPGVGEVACEQFPTGTEGAFFQAYGNDYVLETYSDNDCETNKKETAGGCTDTEDNKFYKIVNK